MIPIVPSTRTIAARIHRAEVALTGLNSDIEIIAALEGSGYTPAKRAEGMSLLTSAQTILGQVQSVRAAQLDATQAFKAAEKSARTAYADLARVVRTLFRNNPAALAELESYLRQLRMLAKIALRSSPQLLEKMGVKA